MAKEYFELNDIDSTVGHKLQTARIAVLAGLFPEKCGNGVAFMGIRGNKTVSIRIPEKDYTNDERVNIGVLAGLLGLSADEVLGSLKPNERPNNEVYNKLVERATVLLAPESDSALKDYSWARMYADISNKEFDFERETIAEFFGPEMNELLYNTLRSDVKGLKGDDGPERVNE